MSTAPVPLTNNEESNDEELAGASPVAINVLADSRGAVRLRPGIVAHSSFYSTSFSTDEISGLRYTNGGKLYAFAQGAASGEMFLVGSGGAASLGSMPGLFRPSIVETEAILGITTGSYPYKVVLATDAMSPLAGGPVESTHIATIDTRLLTNNNAAYRGRIYYSQTQEGSTSYAGHEVWTGYETGEFSTSARPDPVIAIADTTSAIFAFGTSTTSTFVPDSTQDFALVGAIEIGCSARHSIVRTDTGFAWLDDRMRFVSFSGREPEVISNALSLDDITTPSDCFGYRVAEGAYDLLVWTFPTDGQTFVYSNGTWSRWYMYDTGTTGWTRFPVSSHAVRIGYGDNLVGLTDGRVMSLSRTAYSDAGTVLKGYVETGFINRGTDAMKHCKALRIALRRGQTGGTAPTLLVSWRDDLGSWSSDVRVSLGTTGDTLPVVELRSLGSYRRRQWRFTFMDTAELVLAGVSEDFDVLGV